MKKILIILFFIIIPADIFASDLLFFPFDRIAGNPHSALLRSPAIDVHYKASMKDGEKYACYNIGTKFGLLYFKGGKTEYVFSGYGGIYSKFELFSESFNFIHADFLGGGAFDIKHRRFVFENMLYHQSSHIGDDYIYYDNSDYRNVDYEAVKHYTTFTAFSIIDTSIGFEYKFNRTPDDVIFYDRSLFLGNRADLLPLDIPVFFEWEIEFSGFSRSPNIGVKLGTYMAYIFNTVLLDREAQKKQAHELSISWYYGYSKDGYFYNVKENLFMIGATYRI